MILYLEKVSPSGITTTYHKVDSVSLRENQLRCHLESFVSLETMEAKKPANHYSFCFEVSETDISANSLHTILLERITSTAGWEGATEYFVTVSASEE